MKTLNCQRGWKLRTFWSVCVGGKLWTSLMVLNLCHEKFGSTSTWELSWVEKVAEEASELASEFREDGCLSEKAQHLTQVKDIIYEPPQSVAIKLDSDKIAFSHSIAGPLEFLTALTNGQIIRQQKKQKLAKHANLLTYKLINLYFQLTFHCVCVDKRKIFPFSRLVGSALPIKEKHSKLQYKQRRS